MTKDVTLDYKLTDPVELALQRALERLLNRDQNITWRAIIKEGAKEIRKIK